jgi:nicotinamidase-related amidase
MNFKIGVAVITAAVAAVLLGPVSPVRAGNIVDDWAKVKAPPPPALKPVTVDPKTTALLMLDFMHQNCNDKRRPRCVASLPAMKKLLAGARAHNVMVVYTIIRNTTTKDVWADVAPKGNEPWFLAGPDKFLSTALEKTLKDKGIKTVITVGTAAHGAVLYTASSAALRGFQVVIPVDGSSAENEYIEQYVVYNMAHAPVLSSKVTLTTSSMIKF